MTIPFTSSKDGRELALEKKGGAPPKHQTKNSGPVRQPVEQKNNSTSCSNTTQMVRKKELLIGSPSPLKRSEGSSLLVKTRQSSSSPKIDERERRELLYLVIGKKWASLPCMGKGRDPLAGPLPQHLKEAESPFQLHDQKKLAPSASWSTIREREELLVVHVSSSRDRTELL